MNERTKQLIEKLKANGASAETIAALEKEANSNTKVDNELSNGILNNEQYTRFVSEKEEEYKNKIKAIQELGSLNDITKLNPTLLKDAKSRIEELQKYLIEEHGYAENDVKGLSAELITNIDNTIKVLEDTKTIDTNPNLNRDGDRKGTEMTKEELEKLGYVDKGTLNTSMANIIAGNVFVSAKINAAINKAIKLGVEVDDKMIDDFATKVTSNLTANTSVEKIADEHFGFSTKQAELDKKNQDAEITRRTNEEVSKRLKEAGVTPTRDFNIRTPGNIYDRSKRTSQTQDSTNNGSGKVDDNKDTTNINGKEIPVNKYGDPEIWRGRKKTTGERIAAYGERYAQSLETEVERNYGRLD